jgi:hypothetical protein
MPIMNQAATGLPDVFVMNPTLLCRLQAACCTPACSMRPLWHGMVVLVKSSLECAVLSPSMTLLQLATGTTTKWQTMVRTNRQVGPVIAAGPPLDHARRRTTILLMPHGACRLLSLLVCNRATVMHTKRAERRESDSALSPLAARMQFRDRRCVEPDRYRQPAELHTCWKQTNAQQLVRVQAGNCETYEVTSERHANFVPLYRSQVLGRPCAARKVRNLRSARV